MNENKIRVVVVDDSAFMRTAIERMLRSDEKIEIVGTASNGAEAIDLVTRLRPDVVTMDIEMPVMDGLQALKEIMRRAPTPILVVSSLTSKGAKITLDALDLGAVDYIPKPGSTLSASILNLQSELLLKLKAAVGSRPKYLKLDLAPTTKHIHVTEKSKIVEYVNGIVVIGASTGGPPAIQKILSSINPFIGVPIVVAQHMPQTFTTTFASRMNSLCAIRVKEAADGEILQNSVVYVCPGDHKTLVKTNSSGAFTFSVTQEPIREGSFAPSIDMLFASVASLFKTKTTGVILTGMGSDGVVGMSEIQRHGGVTIAQDKATSVIYGMPKAASDAGVIGITAPVDDIAREISLAVRNYE